MFNELIDDPVRLLGFLAWLVTLITAIAGVINARSGSVKNVAEATEMLLAPLIAQNKRLIKRLDEKEKENMELTKRLKECHDTLIQSGEDTAKK